MVDLVLSYSREDALTVERLVRVLEVYGLDIWWDRSLEDGVDFGEVIRSKIHEAKAVVVCWSAAAERSRWVREEASEAQHSGKYVGCLIAQGRPALGFATANMSNLVHWTGAADDNVLLRFLSHLGKAIGSRVLQDLEEAVRRSEAKDAEEAALAEQAARVRAAQEAERKRQAAVAASNATKISEAERALTLVNDELSRSEKSKWVGPFLWLILGPTLGVALGFFGANSDQPEDSRTGLIVVGVLAWSLCVAVGILMMWSGLYRRWRLRNDRKRLGNQLKRLRGT